MKKYLPWIILGVMAAWSLASLRPPKQGAFDVAGFGRLPVLQNGRIQPFDSVARNALLQIRGKQTAPVKLHFSVFDPAKRGELMSASQWLVELMAKPELADTRKVFRIDNPEIIDLLKLPEKDADKGEDGKHFAFVQFEDRLGDLRREANRIQGIEAAHRRPFEKQVIKLQNAVMVYQRLKLTLTPPGSEDFAAELAAFQASLPAGRAAVEAQQAGKPHDETALRSIAEGFGRFSHMNDWAYLLCVPPANVTATNRDGWENVGTNLIQTIHGGKVSPAVLAYARMMSAYRHDKPTEFNTALREYEHYLASSLLPEVRKGRWEALFNRWEPFYKATGIYVLAFLLAAVFWFNNSELLRRSAFYLAGFALLLNSAGLVIRMALEGRPPVTNLYSSAVFIGWGTALLGVILERIYRDGLGSAMAGLAGFITLIIAHNLSMGGDTMEMMRAVLDSNFWLAVHVVTITIGYCGCFAAGVLAIFYILRGVFTKNLTSDRSRSLARMVYGIICFATLFSFVGTVTGGIWADQSWGRFWGWDPKENGALMIVLWCAAILHARWSGWIRERGLMNMAIAGNIITAFSWFGVNMLGIGLHSYGFMDAAFKWLMIFTASQAVLIALGLLPLNFWASFRSSVAAAASAPSGSAA